MASRPVHIKNYSKALADGVIPGEFTTREPLEFHFPKVTSVSSTGAELVWKIAVKAEDAQHRQVSLEKRWLEPGGAAPEGVAGVIVTTSYQVSKGVKGKTRKGGKPTIVRRGKNLGKVNATNPITQALREALGRYNSRVRRAKKERTPPAGSREGRPARAKQPPPMLVKRLGETAEATLTPAIFNAGVFVQRKFNGVRLVTYYDAAAPHAGVQMYSRTENNYPGFCQMRGELLPYLQKAPPVPAELLQPPAGCKAPPLTPDEIAHFQKIYAADHVHLDGEVYKHGKSLRWISGQARKDQEEKDLNLMVFDCFFPAAKAANHDMAGINRQKYLDLFFESAERKSAGGALEHVKRVKNHPAKSMGEVLALEKLFLSEGFEGAIARKSCAGYRYSYNNYHSANLVKIKPIFDSEFDVVGYTQGSKGKDVGAVVWICQVDPEHVKNPSDKTFNVVPKNVSYEERYKIYRCLGQWVPNSASAIAKGGAKTLTRFARDFKGKPLTVEYPARSSKTGKPLQAKALTFRTYEGDLSTDPLKRLYTECADKQD